MSLPIVRSITRQQQGAVLPDVRPVRRGVVLAIMFAAHSFVINTGGPGSAVTAQADKSLDFGTSTAPRVAVGDEVDVEQQIDLHWKVVNYYPKTKCVVAPISPITGANLVLNSSFGSAFPTFSFNIQPLTTFNPPFFKGGQVTPLNQRAPGLGMTYDVGGGYYPSFSSALVEQIGLPNGFIWSTVYLNVSGDITWKFYLDGTKRLEADRVSGTWTLKVYDSGGSLVETDSPGTSDGICVLITNSITGLGCLHCRAEVTPATSASDYAWAVGT